MKKFTNIIVFPTQDLRNGLGPRRTAPGPGTYRGGPLWPWFATQFRARTCRGWLPWPCDDKPTADVAGEPETEEVGIWSGPASPHYGHMIADFGMRIAAASLYDPAVPLVFSVGPALAHSADAETGRLQEGAAKRELGVEADGRAAGHSSAMLEPEPFFWQILDHFRVPAERVRLVRRPTRFRCLLVPPQADRLYGRGPDRAHLDLMDRITAGHGPQPQDLDYLFVSRALYPDGRLAGESYLVDTFVRAGKAVIFPETLTVQEQISHYRRARTIIFTEGSAVHSLQLLGRLSARIVIVARRAGSCIARSSLRPRVSFLEYWDLEGESLHGFNMRGRPQLDRALFLFNEWELLRNLTDLGLDLYEFWDQIEYKKLLIEDVIRWIAYNRSDISYLEALSNIRRQIERLHLPIDVDQAWQKDLFAQD